MARTVGPIPRTTTAAAARRAASMIADTPIAVATTSDIVMAFDEQTRAISGTFVSGAVPSPAASFVTTSSESSLSGEKVLTAGTGISVTPAASTVTIATANHTHESSGVQGGQLDHGLALTGLADDDHSAYALVGHSFVTTSSEARLTGERVLTSGTSVDVTLGVGTATVDLKTHSHQSSGVQGGQLDHGLALTGLSDDDHSIYALNTHSFVTTSTESRLSGERVLTAGTGVAVTLAASTVTLDTANHTHQSSGVQGGQLDHGLALTGLSDDDHSIYALNTHPFVTTASDSRLSAETVLAASTGLQLSGATFNINPAWTPNGLFQGRLTLDNTDAATIADQTAKTSVYLMPYQGNRVCLYTSSVWTCYAMSSTVTLALGTLSSGVNYDVFLYDSSGTLTMEAVAWSSDTARTTALVLQDGVLVKTGATDKRYVGTFRTTSTTQTEDSLVKRFLWNYSHPARLLRAIAKSQSSSYTYSSGTVRQMNGDASYQVEMINGYKEESIKMQINAPVELNGAEKGSIGIGENSTTAYSVNASLRDDEADASVLRVSLSVDLSVFPRLGYSKYTMLESSDTGTVQFVGADLRGQWRC